MRELRAAETARLLRTAFRLLSEPGPEPPTIAAIGDAAGISCPVVIHWYNDVETLGRLAVKTCIERLAASLADATRPALTLHEATLAYAAACAGLFSSDDYRRLIYLVMRDGPSWPWLVAAHEQGIVDAVRAGLARLVRDAGGAAGTQLEIRASGTRAFVRRLQDQLALPMLLPGRKAPTRQQVRAVAERACGDALASVYSAGAVALVLADMVAAGRRAEWRHVRPASFELAGVVTPSDDGQSLNGWTL